MGRNKLGFLLIVTIILGCRISWSQENIDPAQYLSPVGYWYSAPTRGQFGSIFHLYKAGDEIKGTIAVLFPRVGHPDDDLGTKCSGCKGELKDHPTLGLPFMWGFKLSPSSSQWVNGTVLDPRSGGAYHARMETVDGGRRLKVRGYIGTPMLGANVYWTRVTSLTDLNSPLPPQSAGQK